MFIKLAVEEMAPAVMAFGRLGIAAAILFTFLAWRRGVRTAVADVRATGRAGVVLGVGNAAIPFWLIGWGETHVDSGVAAIANASVPVFVALLALRFTRSERVTGLRLVGLVVGLVGVGFLAGANPEGGALAVAGTLAVAAAAFLYATGALLAQHLGSVTGGAVLATVTTVYGALFSLPFGLVSLPGQVPSWQAIASVLALALPATAVAHLVYYRLLRSYGSSRASLVTYLVPGMALVYGAVFLGEGMTLAKIGGLVLILSGVALASGVVRLARRRAAAPVPP